MTSPHYVGDCEFNLTYNLNPSMLASLIFLKKTTYKDLQESRVGETSTCKIMCNEQDMKKRG